MMKRLEEVGSAFGTEVLVDENEVLDQDCEKEQDEPICFTLVSCAPKEGGDWAVVFGRDKMAW